MKLSEELKWRGFVNQTTYKDMDALDNGSVTFYLGVDPSGPGMTVGHLSIAMMIKHLISAGHKPILLVGGASGLIGDPDGKAQERDLKTENEIQENIDKISAQYKKIFEGQKFVLVNNIDWFKNLGYLDFLRTIGKHVPMRTMLGREFVQSRLGENGTGISYAEFSYSLIQGYDFLHLYRDFGATLQVCGADQWGNCIAGVDLIRRVEGVEAHIYSAPLIINKTTGVKFGKTEAGAIWLDPNLTSPFDFYQFWINTDDESAKDYLKIYTNIDKPDYDRLMTDFDADRSGRLAQKTLAYEVTKIVHGQEIADKVVEVTGILFSKQIYSELSESDKDKIKGSLISIPEEAEFLETIVSSGLASSNTEASSFVKSGAVKVNGHKIEDSKYSFSSGDNLLQKGKNMFVMVVKK